jgi:peptidoglycan/LPS O-acetylase OafA/YrhL
MSSTESNPCITADAADGEPAPAAASDEIRPARWWTLVTLAVWLAAAVVWTVHIDRVTRDEGGRSSIDWFFLVPCALIAAVVGAVQAGPRARWWGAILVVAILLTAICLVATFLGTPRDWWQGRG